VWRSNKVSPFVLCLSCTKQRIPLVQDKHKTNGDTLLDLHTRGGLGSLYQPPFLCLSCTKGILWADVVDSVPHNVLHSIPSLSFQYCQIRWLQFFSFSYTLIDPLTYFFEGNRRYIKCNIAKLFQWRSNKVSPFVLCLSCTKGILWADVVDSVPHNVLLLCLIICFRVVDCSQRTV
jgi:hypothetical protein